MTITRVPRRLRTAAAVVAVLAVLGASTSVALSKGLSSLPFDDGFAEIVVIVSDLDTRVAQLIAATGWREEGRGEVDPAVLARWGLPRTATAREALLGEPGTARGRVRLVEIREAGAARRIRSSAMPWESGGWAGVNVRVVNIFETFDRLQREGWQGFSDPVTFDVPPYRVREAMLVGPDGFVLGLLQRVSPPLAGWQWGAAISRPVTVFATVADPAKARRFFETDLGIKVRLQYDGPAAPPGMNLFGLPHDHTLNMTRAVDWHQAAGRDEGTIASIAFRGVVGRRFDTDNGPPNLGLFMVRLFVTDAAARCATLQGRTVGKVRGRYTAEMAPYGRLDGCVLESPDGAWVDLVSFRGGGEKK